ERVAVRWRTHNGLRGDVAAGARPIFDDKLLAKSLREPLTDQACDDVVSASGGSTDDQTHRPRRVGLRPSEARRRQRRSTRSQIQECSAGKFHVCHDATLPEQRAGLASPLSYPDKSFGALRVPVQFGPDTFQPMCELACAIVF